MINRNETLISLWDYLGFSAGNDLGKAVYTYAKQRDARVGTREVSTRTYKGKVMLYEKPMLDSYFASLYVQTLNSTSKTDVKITPKSLKFKHLI